jgi:DNA-binding transcriptional MerR regulator
MSQLTVSKLAQRAGTSPDTLRYYERIGLLPEPERSPSGYRLYGESAAERVQFIKRAQRFGLRLEEIGELLRVRERGLCPCGHTRRLLERRMAELDQEMETLARLRADVSRMVDELPTQEIEGWQCASDLIQIRTKSPGEGPDSPDNHQDNQQDNQKERSG